MSRESLVGTSIVVAGPTAIGKTAVAIEMSRLIPGRFEILSADSIQAYRRFDIGSAKPTRLERAEVPFHLIDIVDPDNDFTLVDYQSAAYEAIGSIVSKGKIPLIVGGTGLYIRAIIRGLGVPVAGPDEKLRAELTGIAADEGTLVLHQRLVVVDPESAVRIHQNDLKRIVRALEVFTLSGRTLSSWHAEDAARERCAPLKYFVLDRDRGRLYESINSRAEAMFQGGIVEEVIALRSDGYSPELKPMTSLGYQQANFVVDNKMTIQEAVELTKSATRHYARRQLIWYRGEDNVEWKDVEGKTAGDVAAELIVSAGLKDEL